MNILRSLSLITTLLLSGPLLAESLLVTAIEDGDTLVVTLENGQEERLQLAGIDAPGSVENAKLKRDLELSGLSLKSLMRLGNLATEHLQHLIKPGESLHITGELDQRDRYGRITAQAVTTAGHSLNDKMVSDGYATALRRHAPDAVLKEKLIKLEQIAFNMQRGLWGDERAAASAWSGRSK